MRINLSFLVTHTNTIIQEFIEKLILITKMFYDRHPYLARFHQFPRPRDMEREGVPPSYKERWL